MSNTHQTIFVLGLLSMAWLLAEFLHLSSSLFAPDDALWFDAVLLLIITCFTSGLAIAAGEILRRTGSQKSLTFGNPIFRFAGLIWLAIAVFLGACTTTSSVVGAIRAIFGGIL